MKRILNIPMSLTVLVLFFLMFVVAIVVSPLVAVFYYPCKIIRCCFSFLSEGPLFMIGFIKGLLEAFSEN